MTKQNNDDFFNVSKFTKDDNGVVTRVDGRRGSITKQKLAEMEQKFLKRLKWVEDMRMVFFNGKEEKE